MIDDTIATIENRVRHASGLSDDARLELQELIVTLKSDVNALRHRVSENAPPAPGDTTRVGKKPSVRLALQNLSDAVAGQEAKHPQITELVNSISQVLSNTGI